MMFHGELAATATNRDPATTPEIELVELLEGPSIDDDWVAQHGEGLDHLGSGSTPSTRAWPPCRPRGTRRRRPVAATVSTATAATPTSTGRLVGVILSRSRCRNAVASRTSAGPGERLSAPPAGSHRRRVAGLTAAGCGDDQDASETPVSPPPTATRVPARRGTPGARGRVAAVADLRPVRGRARAGGAPGVAGACPRAGGRAGGGRDPARDEEARGLRRPGPDGGGAGSGPARRGCLAARHDRGAGDRLGGHRRSLERVSRRSRWRGRRTVPRRSGRDTADRRGRVSSIRRPRTARRLRAHEARHSTARSPTSRAHRALVQVPSTCSSPLRIRAGSDDAPRRASQPLGARPAQHAGARLTDLRLVLPDSPPTISGRYRPVLLRRRCSIPRRNRRRATRCCRTSSRPSWNRTPRCPIRSTSRWGRSSSRRQQVVLSPEELARAAVALGLERAGSVRSGLVDMGRSPKRKGRPCSRP